jgi:hypothetical protein
VKNHVTRFFVFSLLVFTAAALRAQNYSVDWYKISGGGGTSSGGTYQVSGTIGQPDASASGALNGGNFSLTGGFWSLQALQTPGAPLLSIQITSTTTAVVSWPSPSTGFNLQVNTNLPTTNWTAPIETVQDNGTNKFIIVNPLAGNCFYRLKNP